MLPLGLADSCTGPADYYCCLKRPLSIFSTLIFDSSVEQGRPSRDAAPNGPDTRPFLGVSALSCSTNKALNIAGYRYFAVDLERFETHRLTKLE